MLKQEELKNMSSWLFIQEQTKISIFGTLLLFLTTTAQDHSSMAIFPPNQPDWKAPMIRPHFSSDPTISAATVVRLTASSSTFRSGDDAPPPPPALAAPNASSQSMAAFATAAMSAA